MIFCLAGVTQLSSIPSGKKYESNTFIEMGLGVLMAILLLAISSPTQQLALHLYKPSMALCILTMLIGQLIFQVDNKILEAIGGGIIRISKIIGGFFLALASYLALTLK